MGRVQGAGDTRRHENPQQSLSRGREEKILNLKFEIFLHSWTRSRKSCATMSAMLLVIPRHALNVPFSRWSVATMFVVGTTVTGHPPRPLGTLVTLGLIATASVAFALSTTFYLRARGDELRVV